MHNPIMSTALQTYQNGIRIDAQGREIGPIEGQFGWYVRKDSGGRPSIVMKDGAPATLPPNATRSELQRLVNGWNGPVRLYAYDEDGEEIEDAPVAVVYLDPNPLDVEQPHWMRLDRVFDMCERLMGSIETKDMIMGQVTKNLLESHKDLQTGAADLLRTATTTINVATGIERPELDMEAMCERLAKSVENKAQERSRAPWFVQLADTQLGKSVAEMVTGFVQNIASMHDKSEKSKAEKPK